MNRNLRQAYAALDRIEDAAPMAAQDAIRACRAALDLLTKKRKRIAQALPGVSRKAAKEARRQKHAEETAAIRAAVFTRAGGRCEHTIEVRVPPWSLRCVRPPTELHHLEMGVGRRRQRQTVENCRAYCFECHREAHRASKRPSPPRDGRQDTKGAAPVDAATKGPEGETT